MASHVCRSTEELRSAILQEMAHAMTDVRRITQENSENFVWDYYTQGTTLKYRVKNPDNGERFSYVRTFTLPNSAITTPLRFNGDSIEFESGYDEGRVSWDTGAFTPFQVLEATEFHEAGVLGKSGYFRRLENEIDPAINRAFRSRGFR